MTDHEPVITTARPPASEPRARTLRMQRAVNRLIRGLLRTPLLCRLVGARLICVYPVGRKSGRRYAVPVAYTRVDGALLIGTPFPWVRNLRTGEPVEIRYLGRRRSADVEVLAEEERVVSSYAVLARHNHSFAQFNRIALDDDGNPDDGDLHLAWAAGARAVLLTLPEA
jgi:deazaflavin-dependent oxidoreductase (nitroreductase family)